MTEADEKVQRLLLKMFQGGYGESKGSRLTVSHLRKCASAQAVEVDGGDSFYGCETGCEYVRLKATVKCDCGLISGYEYNEFGDMEGLFYEMDRV